MGGGGVVEQGAVVKHASEFVEFAGDKDFCSVKVSFPLFAKRQSHADFPPDFFPSGQFACSAFSMVTMDADIVGGFGCA